MCCLKVLRYLSGKINNPSKQHKLLEQIIERIKAQYVDDLNEEDSEEILHYKNDCQRLVDLLAS